MVISRSRPLGSAAEPLASAAFSASILWCSAISFPTSLGDKPSGTAALLSDLTRPAVPMPAAEITRARRPPGPVRSQSTANA